MKHSNVNICRDNIKKINPLHNRGLSLNGTKCALELPSITNVPSRVEDHQFSQNRKSPKILYTPKPEKKQVFKSELGSYRLKSNGNQYDLLKDFLSNASLNSTKVDTSVSRGNKPSFNIKSPLKRRLVNQNKQRINSERSRVLSQSTHKEPIG